MNVSMVSNTKDGNSVMTRLWASGNTSARVVRSEKNESDT